MKRETIVSSEIVDQMLDNPSRYTDDFKRVAWMSVSEEVCRRALELLDGEEALSGVRNTIHLTLQHFAGARHRSTLPSGL